MTEATQGALPGDDIQNQDTLQSLHFGTLEVLAEAEAWVESQGELWQEGYHFLRARGLRWRDALIATWYSLRRDDRGELPTVQALADFLGISRQRLHEIRVRKNLDEWTGLLTFIRMGGHRLAEVDERTFDAAISAEGSASDRRLYYERARVLRQEIGVGLAADDPLAALLKDLRKEDEDE